jgi:hypothetical protein
MGHIGQYFVTVEDHDGAAIEEHAFVATGHPSVGEEIMLPSGLHVVVRVRHEEDGEGRTLQRYSQARVFVRRGDGSGRAPRPAGTRENTAVLPFAPPAPELATASLLPPSLLAVLVVAGYAEQKAMWRTGWRRVGLLRRVEGRWAVVAAEQLWRDSRRAKRYMLEAAAWTNALVSWGDLTWPSSSAAPFRPRPPAPAVSAPRGSPPAPTPPPRRAPPALRLVRGGPARESDDDGAPPET